jgi:ubiquinone/menaquinone biosynthesis C-methylase UbiE
MNNINSIKKIEHNRLVHNNIAERYNELHAEIYNQTEQLRIHHLIGECFDKIQTSLNDKPLILDYGAGTGNLTNILLSYGARVVAADISEKSLSFIMNSNKGNANLGTYELNGINLCDIENNTFDMVFAYSVMHHIPDYLTALKEILRVTKPGGVVCIDHEVCPDFWNPNNCYKNYCNELKLRYRPNFIKTCIRKIRLAFDPSAWVRIWNRKIHGLHHEGDIHVTKADHIEWDLISNIFEPESDVFKMQDYLVCRERDFQPDIYIRYKSKCCDMRTMIARKRK